MSNLELYNTLFLRSDIYKLKINVDYKKLEQQIHDQKKHLVKYNPRKNIERYGLPITSLDGDITGLPDLDSIDEYNRINKTNYTELDFSTPTKFYHLFNIESIIKPFIPWLCRSHILILKPGGYFPPHIDGNPFTTDVFRVIIPIFNSNYPKCVFLLQDKLLQFEYGSMYVLNTAKEHCVFSMDENINIIFNIKLCTESVKKVFELI